MKRFLALVGIVAWLGALPGVAVGGSTVTNPNTDATVTAATASEYVYVELKSTPAAAAPGLSRKAGGRLDLNASDVRSYRATLAQERRQFTDWARQNAPRAEVVREYDVVLNAVAMKLNGTAASALARGPNVVGVQDSPLYRPLMNRSVGLIDADDAWALGGGSARAGAGIKVGIVDTGIKKDHPFIGADKVVVERVYCSGCPGVSPGDMWSDHGTHVAGTVAGRYNTTASVEGVTITGLSGVAPQARLGNYNVFPSAGAGFIAYGGSAFSHDIARALEDAVVDGMDVVNMSLGGSVQGPRDLLAEATNNTVRAGVVAAVAAGNAGPGDATVESPGSAEKALTAGASTNPHFVGIPVTTPATGTVGAALGDFENFNKVNDRPYVFVGLACSSVSGLSGKIALIQRGTCSFTTKIRNAQNGGAFGALVFNNVAGDPVAMAHDGTSPKPTIPAAMVGKANGEAMRDAAVKTVTVDGTNKQEFVTPNADIIAGFSSRGPSPFNFLIKPDVTGPGVNVLSSTWLDSDWGFFQGTSMATPHVAGAAAVLRWLHGSWAPDDVKSALVTSAKRPVFDHVTGTQATGVLVRGGGRIDVDNAAQVNTLFSPASVSFGYQQGNTTVRESRTVAHTSSSALTIAVEHAASPPAGLSVAVSQGTRQLTVTLSADRSVPSGDYSGDIVVTTGGQTHRLPFWVRIDRKGA